MALLALLGGLVVAGFTALGVATYFAPKYTAKITTKRRLK